MVCCGLFLILTVVPVFAQSCQELCDAIVHGELHIATQHFDSGVSATCRIKSKFKPTNSSEIYFRAKNSPTARIQYPIHFIASADEDYAEWLKLFVEQGVDINMTDNKRQTLLHIAAENQNEELVAAILDYQPNLNLPDAKGNSPLALLINSGTSTDLVVEMLNKGANPKKTTKLNETYLFLGEM